MTSNEVSQLRLAIGDTIIGLNWPSPDIKAMAQGYFGFENPKDSPELIIGISIINRRIPPDIPDSLFLNKNVNGNEFSISDGLIRGTYDPGQRLWDMEVLSPLLDGTFVRIFEQILYQAYYSAVKAADNETFLIHSAGIIRNGSGYLFVGASEKGKSTIANLSKNYHILNDEINLVRFSDTGVTLYGTPFNGFFHDKSVGHAPLKTVFLLEHGPEHQLSAISPAEAVKTLMSQIVPPIGLEETMTSITKNKMFDYAEKIVNDIPVYRLSFKPDNGFWGIIDKQNL